MPHYHQPPHISRLGPACALNLSEQLIITIPIFIKTKKVLNSTQKSMKENARQVSLNDRHYATTCNLFMINNQLHVGKDINIFTPFALCLS